MRRGYASEERLCLGAEEDLMAGERHSDMLERREKDRGY